MHASLFVDWEGGEEKFVLVYAQRDRMTGRDIEGTTVVLQDQMKTWGGEIVAAHTATHVLWGIRLATVSLARAYYSRMAEGHTIFTESD